jgi:hypothetical protein
VPLIVRGVSVFHFKLIELESELLAKELTEQETELTPECDFLLQFVEAEIGARLADSSFKGWRGWLTYRRKKSSLIVCRGRAFIEGVIFRKSHAGLDIPNGLDAVTDYLRGFDVAPPPELDHLLVNFKPGQPSKIMVWYGENLAPYQLFFEAEATGDAEADLKEAIAQGCIWILQKPETMTLAQYLKTEGVGPKPS